MDASEIEQLVRDLSEHRLKRDPTFRPRVYAPARERSWMRSHGREISIGEFLRGETGCYGTPTAVAGYD